MTKDHAWMMLRLLFVIVFILTISYLVLWLFRIAYPFWIAAILVWMSYPLIRWLRKRIHLPNTLAVIVTLLLSIGTMLGALTGLVFLIIFGVRRFSNVVPQWIESTSREIQTFFNETIFPIWQGITGAMDSLTPEQQDAVGEGITTLGTRLAESFTEGGQGLTEALTSILIFVPTSIVVIVFIFIAFYFIGKDWERIFSYIYSQIPVTIVKKSKSFKTMFQYRVFGFLRAQVLLMLIASLIVLIGLAVLQVENAITIAMIVGIAEILPYLGSGTILIPWMLYMFFTGNISMGIGIAILYAVTVLIRQAIEPKVLSSSMNLNALAVLISLFVGWQLFGVIGVFTGPFLLVVIVIFKDIGVLGELYQFVKYGFKEDAPPPIYVKE
ncbi:sporulation integral membrane protein YtvI [Alkalicoccus daliensis]|uniref:Sporulation integral membrane protein YtvI n=1 Tax=Alkalicoccus daliensis TaxID=745820 RepID=A0A1H0DX46_9BACI|nr:sporulation integral membrane protein YtvI [Alkalicoccus daliensis]SDN74827.1 sporulation integral membrane protein YtvI [Alkalicoccus daliensis]